MKIAITGATGFIGRHLVEKLVEEGFNLRILVHNNIDSLEEEMSSLEVMKGDLLKKEALNNFVKDTDLVIHLAGTFLPPFENLMNLNVIATANLLESCYRNKVKKIIFTSSYAVYGEPVGGRASKETDELKPNTFYGLTKKLAEDFLKYYDDNFGIKYVTLRLSSVYGPDNNKGVIYNFLNSIKKEGKVTIYGDGSQARGFLFVSDAVASIIKIIKEYDFKRSETFNISSEQLINLNDLIKTIEKLLQRRIEIIYKPQEDNFVQVLWEDIRKAKKILNWQPKISLEEGLKVTMDSFKL